MGENNNMKYYDQMRRPPKEALKKITAGRTKGMSDISPQWRFEIMTEVFGPCGIGWRHELANIEFKEVSDNQVFVMVVVNLYIRENGEWSEAIPGTGGDFLVKAESRGLFSSDEAVKMAYTDALGVCCKYVGVGADIYRGMFDGSKYRDEVPKQQEPKTEKKKIKTEAEKNAIVKHIVEGKITIEKCKSVYEASDSVWESIAKLVNAAKAVSAKA